jgi:two-component system OmpR family response regulator
MAQILLIEPDHRLAETCRQALEFAANEVITTHSAQAAITAADTAKPDLVILELQLIEHSGIEFLYEFRSYQDWQTTPVLIFTHVPPGEFDNSRQLLHDGLGVQAYLYKPWTSLHQLLAQVDEFIPVKA